LKIVAVAAVPVAALRASTQFLTRRRRKCKPILFRIKPPAQKRSLRRPGKMTFTTMDLKRFEMIFMNASGKQPARVSKKISKKKK
jgi:hypothetical protein